MGKGRGAHMGVLRLKIIGSEKLFFWYKSRGNKISRTHIYQERVKKIISLKNERTYYQFLSDFFENIFDNGLSNGYKSDIGYYTLMKRMSILLTDLDKIITCLNEDLQELSDLDKNNLQQKVLGFDKTKAIRQEIKIESDKVLKVLLQERFIGLIEKKGLILEGTAIIADPSFLLLFF